MDVAVDPSWIDHAAAEIGTVDASGTRLRLLPGADPGEVLDSIRAHARPNDFGVEAPTLSELFLDATGEHADRLDEGELDDGRDDGSRDAPAERETSKR